MPTEHQITSMIPYEPDSFGKKMQACTENQQRFVLGHIYYQGRAPGRAAAEAGYSPKTSDQIAHNLLRNVRVQEAIHEEATRQLHSSVALGLGVIMQIAMNDGHKDQLKAAKMLAEGGRLITPADQVIEVKHTTDEKTQVKAISHLARQLGLDPSVLLGQYGVVVDAEFEDVTHKAQPVPVRQLAGPEDEWTVYPES